MCFLDRQSVLRILSDHIAEKEKVLLNKRIVKADHHDDGVTITCTDGSSYDGDILVGADGVFSIVRQEMWRASEAASPGTIPDGEKKSMLAEYKCLFGISSPIADLPAHEFDVTYMKDITPIVITSKNGRVYWFLIARMPQIYQAGEIPRFSKDEARAFAEENLDIPLMPGKKVTIRNLWENRETFNLVALEEAYYSHWTWGRFACVGDSIHKMTPNMGSGGNSAIESAAALANSLHELLSQPSSDCSLIGNVRQALDKYQNSRSIRASATVKVSNLVTRLHAVRGLIEYILAHYLMPNAGDLLVDLASDNWIGATRLNYLPIPPRSLGGTMPFNPEQGLGKNESLFMRALAASPFLSLCVYHSRLMKSVLPGQALLTAVKAGRLELGRSSVHLFRNFYRIPYIDILWRPIVALFLPSNLGYDVAGSWQLGSSLADFGTVYAILLIESARRANLLTPMQM
jgi:2-polyprenyl-6-methoxyphenol hydroxylase-like FAD-dependent oxidoreductase